jgi:CubicO group peptidase (beta-lactamase class C family)
MNMPLNTETCYKFIFCLIFLSLILLRSYGQVEITSGATERYTQPFFSDAASRSNLEKFFPVVADIYEAYAEKNKFPSITYGVIVGDQLVFAGSTGLANLETQTKATTHTVYRIASMSKSFTAMGILQLRDAGKLQLSDPVTRYIPVFRHVMPLTSDAPAITIQHLMTMSAGFPEDNPWGDRQLSDTNEELLGMVSEGLSLSNVPGISYEYSNLGYALLGQIISKVSGVPYQQYITENILASLGMAASTYQYTDVPPELLAQGYRWEDDEWKEEPILADGSYGAMGGMLCSLEDFARYVLLHINAWPPRSEPEKGPVRRATIREMQQPWRFNNLVADATDSRGETCPIAVGYGYGLAWRKDCHGTVRISHGGGLPGYGSEWRIYPEYRLGVFAFSNRTYGSPAAANARVLDTLIQLAALKPMVLPAIPLLEKTKDRILQLLPDWREPLPDDLFAENFFLDQDLRIRKTRTQKIFDDAGSIKRISGVQPENQLRGRFMVECEYKNIVVFFTMTPEKNSKVQQLNIWLEEKNKEP